MVDTGIPLVRAYWNEPDLIGELAERLDSSHMVLLYELTGGGHVLRAIELTGTDLVPVGAASLAEFWELQDNRQQPATPALLAYHDRFGEVPEGSEADWGDYPHEEITANEFERVWQTSRAHLVSRPGSAHLAR